MKPNPNRPALEINDLPCREKRSFVSKQAAKVYTITDLPQRHRAKNRIYRCPLCQLWHLTTRKKKRKR